MLNSNIWCIIMAGGTGTRFWPVSRQEKPKQFVNIAGLGRSFLRNTFLRFENLIPPERTIVITSGKYRHMVHEELPELPETNILSEPYKRDTAPCIAYAMYSVLRRDPNAVMVVVPSDHLILGQENFEHVIGAAVRFATRNDVLMTIGIQPTRPDSNYGYIQGVSLPQEGTPVAVKTFTEKPDMELARVFVQSGEFLWNSGIFVWRADMIRREIEKYMPELATQFRGWEGALGSSMEEEFIEKAYAECQKVSIDYGVMEKTSSAWVYPADFTWFDVGTWESLYSMIPDKDGSGNASNVPMMVQDSSNNMMLCMDKKDKLFAVCGLDDYAIVDTEQVLLICPKDDGRFRDFMANLAMPQFEKYR